MGRMTKLAIDRLSVPGRYIDGDGLYLQISKTGGRSWLLRYQLNHRPRFMGLGPVNTVPLAEARELAHAARRQLLAGVDPIEQRRRQRAEQRLTGLTFRAAAETVFAEREGKWRNAAHRQQWRSTLEKFVYPVIGNLPVGEVDTQSVLRCLKPIWTNKRVTAGRVRQRIEAILSWATAHGHRQLKDNPARWRGHLQHLLSDDAKVQHLKAMPYADVPDFFAVLRSRPGAAARALEFTVLTACRTGEALGAVWSEIAGDTWAIPPARTKTGVEHRVPLSSRAIEILEALPRDRSDFLFIGGAGKPLNRHAMHDLLGLMGRPCTVHGFRASFATWVTECTGYEDLVRETALGHSILGKVARAYSRGDLFEKRRRLMTDWASYCANRPATENVALLRKRDDG